MWVSTRCCGKTNGTVSLDRGVQDLTKAMMSRLILAGQRRLSQERQRGRACAKAERPEETHSVFRGLQVAYVARMWGVEERTGTKVAKHKGLCVARCRVWLLFSE